MSKGRKINKYKAAAAVIVGAAAIFCAAKRFIPGDKANGAIENPGMLVHYIDVGEADSEFIQLPDGKTMLIDAGEAENGTQIVEYIRNCGVERVDYVVGTHPHADHIGGIEAVIESFDIGEIYMPKVTHTSDVFEDLLIAVKNKNMQINTAKAGVGIFKDDEYSIEILAPDKDKYSNLNNYSAVIKITFDDVSFLFTGDAENEVLKTLTSGVTADVLKVSHHGSDTADSKEFLQSVNPKYAVISVGKGNMYGHPDESVLNNLKKIGAKVYRTDENGTIVAKTDGKSIVFETER